MVPNLTLEVHLPIVPGLVQKLVAIDNSSLRNSAWSEEMQKNTVICPSNTTIRGGVFMDLSKAVDMLDHDLLLARLDCNGFNKDVLMAESK